MTVDLSFDRFELVYPKLKPAHQSTHQDMYFQSHFLECHWYNGWQNEAFGDANEAVEVFKAEKPSSVEIASMLNDRDEKQILSGLSELNLPQQPWIQPDSFQHSS